MSQTQDQPPEKFLDDLYTRKFATYVPKSALNAHLNRDLPDVVWGGNTPLVVRNHFRRLRNRMPEPTFTEEEKWNQARKHYGIGSKFPQALVENDYILFLKSASLWLMLRYPFYAEDESHELAIREYFEGKQKVLKKDYNIRSQTNVMAISVACKMIVVFDEDTPAGSRDKKAALNITWDASPVEIQRLWKRRGKGRTT